MIPASSGFQKQLSLPGDGLKETQVGTVSAQ